MFIVWGTKIIRKKLGRHADFCQFCRDFQPSRVVDVQSVGHLYYIPLGRRQNLGLEFTCESCGLFRSKTYENGYPITVRGGHADVETLIAETNPDARRDWSNRLAIEGRIRANQLTPDERIPVLFESFLLSNALLDQRKSTMKFDNLSGLCCLGAIAPLVALPFIPTSLSGSLAEMATTLAIGTAIGCAILTLFLLITDDRRHVRRAILPILIRAIRPIRPTDQEIETVLNLLRDRKAKLAKILKPQTVMDALLSPAD